MRSNRKLACVSLVALAGLSACAGGKVTYVSSGVTSGDVEGDASPRGPGLGLGAEAPDAELRNENGEEVSLASLYPQGPTIVVFYRGGWCTYCNQTLALWAEKLPEVEAAGARVVALSPETPEHATETNASHGSGLTIFSDTRQEAAERFGVLDELGTLDRVGYSLNGIDLEDWNDSGTWALPAAATFVVDTGGVIRYRFADWDHTKRADPDDVLRIVRGLEG